MFTIFCKDERCTKTFESLAEFEEHRFLGIHPIPKITPSFDSVRQAFATHMLSSTMNHSSLCPYPALCLSSTSSVGGLRTHYIFN